MRRLMAVALLAGVLPACSSGGGTHKATPAPATTVPSPSTVATPSSLAAPTTMLPRPGEAVAAETLGSITFADASHGFGLTYQGVVAITTDGGATWVAKSQVSGPPDDHGKIVFLNRADGVVLSNGLRVTHDGARTWVKTSIARARDIVAAGTSLWAFVAEPCASDQSGCAGRLEESTDAGRRWRDLPSQPPPGAFAALARASSREAYLASASGRPGEDFGYHLSSTTDSGRHWRSLDPPCDKSTVDVAVAASAGGRVWMICASQPATIMQFKSLYRSADGGVHWHLVATTGGIGPTSPPVGDIPLSGHLSALFVGSDLRAWMLLGRTGLWTTANGGGTWQLAFPVEVDGQGGPATFIDSRYGWAVAERVVWRTTDGSHWMPLGTPAT